MYINYIAEVRIMFSLRAALYHNYYGPSRRPCNASTSAHANTKSDTEVNCSYRILLVPLNTVGIKAYK